MHKKTDLNKSHTRKKSDTTQKAYMLDNALLRFQIKIINLVLKTIKVILKHISQNYI